MSTYSITDAAQVDDMLQEADCVSTSPRYNAAGTQAVLRWCADGVGRISHADARALMATAAWQVEP
ncbi:MAG: hypothetical protein CL490_12875 [Acinetobacter sp.]|nr:hypothetical protein [Acinetobacter sp.]